jgi:hypothetical protein
MYVSIVAQDIIKIMLLFMDLGYVVLGIHVSEKGFLKENHKGRYFPILLVSCFFFYSYGNQIQSQKFGFKVLLLDLHVVIAYWAPEAEQNTHCLSEKYTICIIVHITQTQREF